jgi:DNA-binding MarR family transcriptional regulator
VRLTPEGRDLIDRAIAAHLAGEHRLVGELGATDAASLEQILTRWLRLLEER